MSEKKVDVEVSKEDIDKAMGNPQKQAQMSETEQINLMMKGVKHKIIVCSGKGGVGKTTVAVNLAIALAIKGLRVGILDVDITGPNVPKMLNLEGERPEVIPGTNTFKPVSGPMLSSGGPIQVMSMAFLLETPDTPVIWRGPLKMKAIRQFIAEGEWGELDYLILDLPPGTSDETLDAMQLVGDNSGVVIVTTPQEVATMDSRKTINMSKAMKLNVIGIIENMSGLTVKCPKCEEEIKIALFGSGGGQKAAKDLDVPFLGKVPIEHKIMQQGDKGVPFLISNPDSVSASAFDEIVKRIRTNME